MMRILPGQFSGWIIRDDLCAISGKAGLYIKACSPPLKGLRFDDGIGIVRGIHSRVSNLHTQDVSPAQERHDRYERQW